jgi:pimeloyl-ACP methyl ester carboxylesterase
MLADLKLKPVFMARDGVRLAHFEAGPANPESPPLVLVNGWTGDHGIFTPQIIHFARNHRVVAINLRGHGASDAPKQEYTIVGFADDIAWQGAQLGLKKPLIIGHSLGGVVTLELCGRYPDLASGMMMIDSIVMAPPNVRDAPAVHRLCALPPRNSECLMVTLLSGGSIACGTEQIASQPMQLSLADPLLGRLDDLRSLGEVVVLFGCSFAFFLHLCGGIRDLVWETVRG